MNTRCSGTVFESHGNRTVRTAGNISAGVMCLLSVLLAVSGCSTTGEKPTANEASVSEASVQSTQAEGAMTQGAEEGVSIQGASEGAAWTGAALDDPQSPLYTKIIYFEFDSSEVDAEYWELLAAHADYIAAHPSLRVRLEGNCDERGSREYNIGLGERRSVAVKRLLVAGGVQEMQIDVISYGEEQPVADGQNEEAWGRNRRVDIAYENGG